MKYLCTIFIISMLTVSGCSNNESENHLKQENEQLKKENAMLLVEKKQLESDQTIEVSSELSQKNDQLNYEIKTLQADNEEQNEMITRYQKAFEFLNTNTNTLVNTLSIFSLEEVKEGNKIAGLTVSDVYMETTKEPASYNVKFSGEFQVSGSIVHNVIGGSKYSFIVRENLERMPHTLEQFQQGSVYLDIENEDGLKKALGDKLEQLPENGELEIEGIFKNYSYIYVPETDFPSSAEFVRLKEQN